MLFGNPLPDVKRSLSLIFLKQPCNTYYLGLSKISVESSIVVPSVWVKVYEHFPLPSS